MNMSNKDTDLNGAVRSGTGVFYQAMPAIGADGRNIMKLIPVQKVNGQFIQSQLGFPRPDNPVPQRVLTRNPASAPVQKKNMQHQVLEPSTNGHIGKTSFPPRSDLQHQVLEPSTNGHIGKTSFPPRSDLQHQVLEPSTNGHIGKTSFPPRSDLQHQREETRRSKNSASNLLSKIAQVSSCIPNREKVATLISQLPVTVKSPVLPMGQYLQIPPNAQVRTLPASALPPAIKKQIFTSSVTSASSSPSPTVLYVSPVTTMKQGITPPTLPPPPTAAPLCSFKLPATQQEQSPAKSFAVAPTSASKSIAKDSQRRNGPIKWVIEEQDGAYAPCLVPANSAVMASKIIKAVAERENYNKPHENNIRHNQPQLQPSTSPSNQSKQGEEKDNALVMCNGKVYFVAKKCNLPFKMGDDNGKESSQTKSSPAQQSRVSVTSQTPLTAKASSQVVILDGADDVIDLCDDDPQDVDVAQQACSQQDEDNVIFVSYIPPKSASNPTEPNGEMTQGKRKAAQQEVDNEVDPDIISIQDNVTGPKVVRIWGNARNLLPDSFENASTARPYQITTPVQNITRPTAIWEKTTGPERENTGSTPISKDTVSTHGSGPKPNDTVKDNKRQKFNYDHRTTQETKTMDARPMVQDLDNKRLDESTPENTGRDACDPKNIEGNGNSHKVNSDHSATTQPVERVSEHSIIPEMKNGLLHDTTPCNTDGHSIDLEIANVQSACTDQNIINEHSSTTQQTESSDTQSIDQEMKDSLPESYSPSNASQQSGPCIQMEIETDTVKIAADPVSNLPFPLAYQKSSQMYDRLQRKAFGITSDIKICLKRINANSSVTVVMSPDPSTSTDTLKGMCTLNQESRCGLENEGLKESQGSQKRNSDSHPVAAKKQKLTVQQTSVDSTDSLVTQHPQVDFLRLTEPNLQQETKPLICPGPQMDSKDLTTPSPPEETQCNTELTIIGPVGDDPSSVADENNIPNPQDKSPHLQTETSGAGCSPGTCCTDTNTKPKRQGRQKKCTVCPCGTAGTPGKTSAKSSDTKQKESDLTKQKGPGIPSETLEVDRLKEMKNSVLPAEPVQPVRKRGRPPKASKGGNKNPSAGLQCLSTDSEHSRTRGEIPFSDDMSTTLMDSEEIKRHEQIKRLQDLLKEKEAALETIRKTMGQVGVSNK